jgi:hypothetical protein
VPVQDYTKVHLGKIQIEGLVGDALQDVTTEPFKVDLFGCRVMGSVCETENGNGRKDRERIMRRPVGDK